MIIQMITKWPKKEYKKFLLYNNKEQNNRKIGLNLSF